MSESTLLVPDNFIFTEVILGEKCRIRRNASDDNGNTLDTQLTVFLSSSYKEVPTVCSKIKLILQLFK
jgi:hypothetical protein